MKDPSVSMHESMSTSRTEHKQESITIDASKMLELTLKECLVQLVKHIFHDGIFNYTLLLDCIPYVSQYINHRPSLYCTCSCRI